MLMKRTDPVGARLEMLEMLEMLEWRCASRYGVGVGRVLDPKEIWFYLEDRRWTKQVATPQLGVEREEDGGGG